MSGATSRSVNSRCGIYCVAPTLLDRIPATGLYDFGADLVPSMLNAGEDVGGFVTDAYWNDIGTPGALLAANLDVVAGCGPAQVRATHGIDGARLVDPSAHVHPGASVGPGVLISADTSVDDGAVIVGPAVIGARASTVCSDQWLGMTTVTSGVTRALEACSTIPP